MLVLRRNDFDAIASPFEFAATQSGTVVVEDQFRSYVWMVVKSRIEAETKEMRTVHIERWILLEDHRPESAIWSHRFRKDVRLPVSPRGNNKQADDERNPSTPT